MGKKKVESLIKKTNKTKGFTLVEILVVLGLVGFMLVLAISGMEKLTRSTKERELETKKEVMVSAAEVYAKNNQSLFGDSTVIKIPVRTLIYYGYLSTDQKTNSKGCNDEIGCVMNPTNDESMNDDIITIRKIKSIIQANYGNIDYPETIYATFHSNGATISGAAHDYIRISCKIIAGETCVLENIPQIERTGFVIDGWNTDLHATTGLKDENNNDLIEFSSNIDYYAITHKDVKATFYSNTGVFADSAGTSQVKTCTIRNAASTCNITDIPNVSKKSHTFLGWYSATEGGQPVSFTDLTNNITAHAQWKKTPHILTIMYNGNGHTGFSSNSTDHSFTVDSNGNLLDHGLIFKQTVLEDEVVDSSSGLINYNNKDFVNFTKTNYVAIPGKEWFVTDSNNTKTAFNQADTTVTADQIAEAAGCDLSDKNCEVTLKVNWIKDTYTIFYDITVKLTHVHYKDGGNSGTIDSKVIEDCRLRCTNLPNKFVSKDVTYYLQCYEGDGYHSYTKAESTQMYKFMHFMSPSRYNQYGCTTRRCYHEGCSGAACYDIINFSKVQSVSGQYSCEMRINEE